eukprot:UN01804
MYFIFTKFWAGTGYRFLFIFLKITVLLITIRRSLSFDVLPKYLWFKNSAVTILGVPDTAQKISGSN